MRCDDSRGGQASLRVALLRGYPQPTDNHESGGVCGTARSENLWDDPIFDPIQNQELSMDNIGYGRCSQCDEEYFLQDGSRCARCLGLSAPPIDDENYEEESLSISLEQAA